MLSTHTKIGIQGHFKVHVTGEMFTVHSKESIIYQAPHFHTFTLLDIDEAFITRGHRPYSANNPSIDDMKTYLSSSTT